VKSKVDIAEFGFWTLVTTIVTVFLSRVDDVITKVFPTMLLLRVVPEILAVVLLLSVQAAGKVRLISEREVELSKLMVHL